MGSATSSGSGVGRNKRSTFAPLQARAIREFKAPSRQAAA